MKSQIGRWAVPFAAGALATGLVMWTPSQPAPGTTAPLPRQVTFDGSAEKPVFSPDGSTLAYQVKRCSDAGQCWAELERQELASGDPLPILVTVDDDGESIRPRWFWDIAWSPDGQQLLVAAGFADKRLNGLYQIPSVGGSAIRLAPGTVTSVRYRPPLGTIVDWILFPKGLQTDTPPVWQSIDLRTHVITDHELVFPASDLQWSPDARWLALSRGSGDWLARGESNVAILSPAGEVVDTRLIPAPPGWARTRWDTNGTLLYAASRGTLVGLTVNAGTGSISGTPQEVVDTLQPPGWSEFEFDRTVGGLAAYSRYQFRTVLRVISRSNATIATELLDDSTGFKGYPALSDNGRDVAFVKQDLLGINVYVKSLATGDTRRLTDTDSNKRHPQWSPDGLLLAFVDSTDEESTRLFVVGRTGDRPRPVGRLSGISHAAPFGWGADSALLVYTAGGAVWRSNVDGGEHELLDLPQPITNAWGLTVSPDGSTLALLSHYYQGDTSILRIHTADMRDPDGGWTVRFEGNWDDWLVDGVEGAQSTFDGWVQLTLLPWREDGVLDIGYSLATGRRDVTAIWRVTLSSGQARRAIDLSGVCTGIPTVSATRDFSRVVCPQTTASRDIWIVEPPDGRGGRW